MNAHIWIALATCFGLFVTVLTGAPEKDRPEKIGITPPHISTDKSVTYDYDIVYVRAPRYADEKRPGWAEFSD